MVSDTSRVSLVTSFLCSQCGHNLELSFDGGPVHDDADTSHDITGALHLPNRIHVHPCRRCIDKATAPARAIKKALRELT